jgi:hypothetical protein
MMLERTMITMIRKPPPKRVASQPLRDATLGIRVTRDLQVKLVASATRNKRSLSQECAWRLQQSLDADATAPAAAAAA